MPVKSPIVKYKKTLPIPTKYTHLDGTQCLLSSVPMHHAYHHYTHLIGTYAYHRYTHLAGTRCLLSSVPYPCIPPLYPPHWYPCIPPLYPPHWYPMPAELSVSQLSHPHPRPESPLQHLQLEAGTENTADY